MTTKVLPFLHLHAQPESHMEAWVVGNREGLMALRKALDEALESDERSASTEEVFAADNEGFKVLVVVSSAEEVDRKDVAFPYTSHIYYEKVGRKHPMSLIGPSRYRELVLTDRKDDTE